MNGEPDPFCVTGPVPENGENSAPTSTAFALQLMKVENGQVIRNIKRATVIIIKIQLGIIFLQSPLFGYCRSNKTPAIVLSLSPPFPTACALCQSHSRSLPWRRLVDRRCRSRAGAHCPGLLLVLRRRQAQPGAPTPFLVSSCCAKPSTQTLT